MNATTGTIVRTIVGAITGIFVAIQAFGVNIPIVDMNEFTRGITAVIEFAVIAWVWWKNNSLTAAAVAADVLKDEYKEGVKIESDHSYDETVDMVEKE